MSATAKDTRAALKAQVLPLLKDHGFSDGTPSRLWRHTGERIDYIELPCLSAYDAQVLDASTASFTVRIAISLPKYSALLDPFQRDHIKDGPKGPRPSEPQMPIRGVLCPKASPRMKKGRWGWETQSTWTVTSLDDAQNHAADLAEQLQAYALDWLSRDWAYADLLALLKKDETSPILIASENGSHLRLAAEVKGSQIRAAHIAMVKTALSGKARHLPG